ncbi:unnamed protein product [Parnassius apollo]|uniref:(apollo) hypothetical protein n=1 Tax=Parnassius apollo TaxID=110799 RepID=A0A8S3Y6S5_PARAO|nr:unnamed protein product [Parnassius apollo]
MSSKRYIFLNTLKEDAIKGRKFKITEQIRSSDQICSPSRQDTPVPFSKDFTEEDLQKLTEMIEDSDEEPSAKERDLKAIECSINHSSITTSCEAPVVLSEDCFHDPTLAPIMPQSPMMISFSSECAHSPAPIPLVAMPVSSPVPIETQSSENALHNSEPPPRKRQITRKKDKGRLRLIHRDQWLDVQRKTNKNLGKAYKGRDGRLRKGKEMGLACGENCKLKCSQKVTDFERNLLFKAFWSMGEIVRHWDFINKYCDKIPKRRVTTETASRREFTLRYYLPTKVDEIQNAN